jgi:hypothetical protein
MTRTTPGRRRGSNRRRIPWLVILLTSLAVAVFSPLQYAGGSLESLGDTAQAGTYANRPPAVQVAFYIHITFAGLALLVGGFQFSHRLRRWSPTAHRWVGRTYAVSVFAGGTAAFVMSFFSSVAFLGFFGFGTLAVLWVWTTYRGWRSAREHDMASHQAWMIRSFALSYAAPTLRMWLLLLIFIQVPFGVDEVVADANAYAPVAFLCWLPNIVVAEIIIYRRGLPAFTLQSASEARAGRGVRRAAPAN